MILASLHVVGCSGAAPPPPPPATSRPAASTAPSSRPATAPAASRFEYHEVKLGSAFNLVLYAKDQATADAAARDAFALVDRLDLVFSDYNPQSELSLLGARTREGPMPAPVDVSPDMIDLLLVAGRAAELTGGLFDCSVGPYVQLWRRSKRLQQLPTPERLAEAKASVGWDKVALVPPEKPGGPGKVQLKAAKMRLDVGGIAGGYIADRVLALLRGRGVGQALVDSSGDLAVGDPPPGRAGWHVAIQSLAEPNKVVGYVEVANCGVSTSGDTYRFVEIDGVRYSHVLDPRTGLGLTHSVGVTVIARDGTTADWVTKPISVLGAEKGLAFVEVLDAGGKVGPVGARVTTVGDDGKVNDAESKRYKQVIWAERKP
ncbi:MAG TPA: FAD:protein FMN transferase [Humisphaera sp.]